MTEVTQESQESIDTNICGNAAKLISDITLESLTAAADISAPSQKIVNSIYQIFLDMCTDLLFRTEIVELFTDDEATILIADLMDRYDKSTTMLSNIVELFWSRQNIMHFIDQNYDNLFRRFICEIEISAPADDETGAENNLLLFDHFDGSVHTYAVPESRIKQWIGDCTTTMLKMSPILGDYPIPLDVYDNSVRQIYAYRKIDDLQMMVDYYYAAGSEFTTERLNEIHDKLMGDTFAKLDPENTRDNAFVESCLSNFDFDQQALSNLRQFPIIGHTTHVLMDNIMRYVLSDPNHRSRLSALNLYLVRPYIVSRICDSKSYKIYHEFVEFCAVNYKTSILKSAKFFPQYSLGEQLVIRINNGAKSPKTIPKHQARLD
jgi:hypothetical protein